jgi:transposase
MPNIKIQVDLDLLRDLYQTQHLSIHMIGEKLGLKRSTIINRLSSIGLINKQSTKTKELIEEHVRKAYLEDGKSFDEMAAMFGCSDSGVRKFIIRHGFLKPNPKQRKPWKKFTLTEEELRDQFLNQKLSDAEIGRRVGVNNATVGKWRERWGIQRQAPVHRIDLPEAELKEMYVDRKMKMLDIAKEFNCHISLVRSNIIRYGLLITPFEKRQRRSLRNAEKRVGKKTYDGSGYVRLWLPDHPFSSKSGYIDEHRKVVIDHIGEIGWDTHVHHINHIRHDNRICNLAAIHSKKEHTLVHRFMDRLCIYLLGMVKEKPEPVIFSKPTFWGGQYITQLDGSGPWPSLLVEEYSCSELELISQ